MLFRSEESKEVIPMMEAMITQIEEQQNIMAEMLQEIQEKDEKLMCFQEKQKNCCRERKRKRTLPKS